MHVADGPVNDKFNITKYREYLAEHPIQQRPTIDQKQPDQTTSLPIISPSPQQSIPYVPCLQSNTNVFTYSSWTEPDSWDTNPLHPDYYVLTISGGPPLLPGVTVTLTKDRYNDWFIGGGLNYGKSFEMVAINLTGGFIGSGVDKSMPDKANSINFLSGVAVNVSGGAVGGGGFTWSPFASKYVDHKAWELGGFIIPNFGISITYNKFIP